MSTGCVGSTFRSPTFRSGRSGPASGRSSMQIQSFAHIQIEEGVSLDIPNRDWQRPFHVFSKNERDGIMVYLCRFSEAKPSTNGESFAFVGFVVARGHRFTEAAPV